MAEDQKITTQMAVEPDKQAQTNTQKALEAVRKEILDLAKKAVDADGNINQSVQERIKELKKLEKEYASLSKIEQDAAKEAKKQQDAAEKAANAELKRLAQIEKEQQKLLALRIKQREATNQSAFAAADEFNSQGRRQVGGLGDIDTAFSALGATDVGAVFGMAEAVGQLPGAFAAAKAGVISFLASLGPFGIAAVGLGAVVAVVSGEMRKAEQAAEDYTKNVLQAQKEASEFLRDASREETEQRIADIQAQIAENEKYSAGLRNGLDAAEEAVEGLEFWEEGAFRLGDALGIAGGELDAARGELEATTEETAGLTTELELLQKGLEDGATAARDYADAALKEAQAVGDRVRIEQQAADATAEENQKRLEGIADERAAIEASLASLEASGATGEEVADEIERLNEQLSKLDEEAEIVSKFADATEDATEAVEDATKAEQDRVTALQRANEQIMAAETQRADRIADANQKAADSFADAKVKLTQDINDIGTKFNQAVVDTFIKGFQEQQKAARDHQRTLKKIQDDADKERENAAAALDFKRLFEIEENTNDAINAEIDKYNAELHEREIAQGEQLQSLKRSLDREEDARRTAYRRQEQQLRTNLDRMTRDVDTAFERTVRSVEMALAVLQKAGANTLQGLQKAAQQTINNVNNSKTVNAQLTQNFNGGSNLNAAMVGQVARREIVGLLNTPL